MYAIFSVRMVLNFKNLKFAAALSNVFFILQLLCSVKSVCGSVLGYWITSAKGFHLRAKGMFHGIQLEWLVTQRDSECLHMECLSRTVLFSYCPYNFSVIFKYT